MSTSEAFAGFASGIINDTVLFHSDNLKYLQQNNQRIRPLSSWADFKFHFRGAPFIIFGGGLSYASFFYSYGLVKTKFEPAIAQRLDPDSPFSKFILAGISGAMAIIPSTIVGYPFDQLKKHTASLPDLTFRQVGQKIYTDKGPLGFYYGWNYTISRDIYMSAVKMAIFETASKLCVNLRTHPRYPQWLREGGQSKGYGKAAEPEEVSLQKREYDTGKAKNRTLESAALSTREVVLVGLLSGMGTSICSMPIDCIVSRMRSPTTPHEAKKSFMTMSKWMIEQDQSYIKPFFRGTGLRTFNYAAGSMVFWSCFNFFQQVADQGVKKTFENVYNKMRV